MNIKFWGTRGSIPVPGEKALKYGGNTSCIQITLDDGQIVLLDAGSGIREFGNNFLEYSNEKRISIFISHTHWDHIQGLPFFKPLFNPDFTVDIYLFKKKNSEISQVIKGQINNYFFPITSELLPAKINYHQIKENDSIEIGDAKIIAKSTRHSEGTFAYKIVENDRSVIYMTDNEINFDTNGNDINTHSILHYNEDLIEFCKDADYLIHDTMYLFKDYKKDWGHSNDLAVAAFGHFANVKNLILFHYNPEYDDETVDNLFNSTKQKLIDLNSNVKCFPSTESMSIDV